jgi:hypothetical protein
MTLATGSSRKDARKSTYPAGKHRKSLEHGSSIPAKKNFGFFPVDSYQFPVLSGRNTASTKSPELPEIGRFQGAVILFPKVTHSCIVQNHQIHQHSIPEFLHPIPTHAIEFYGIPAHSCPFLHRLMYSCSTKPCYRNKNAIPAIPAIPAYSCNSCLFLPIPALLAYSFIG